MSSSISNTPTATDQSQLPLTASPGSSLSSAAVSSADVSSSPSPLSPPEQEHSHHQHRSPHQIQQPTSESIRKLIASNFNIGPSVSEASQNTQSSSSGNVTPRNKSNSISNGVLSHARAASKKVSFSDFHSMNSSQVFTSSSGSSANSSDNDEDYEDEYTIRDETRKTTTQKNKIKNPQSPSAVGSSRNVQFSMSVTPSPLTISPIMSNTASNTTTLRGTNKNKSNNSLRKFASYGGERLAMTKSLDTQLLEPSDSTSSMGSLLPEFNKRPLTDTPIVSSMGSPVTREQSSEEDENIPGTSIIHEEDEGTEAAAVTTTTVPPLRKTRNISHLNLSDLAEAKSNHEEKQLSKSNSEAVGDAAVSLATTGAITTPPEFKITNARISPDTPSPPTPTIQMKQEIKDTLLKDVPSEMMEQFEKTPSLEHLKTLLMTKPPPSARKAYTLNIPGQTSSKTSPDGKIAQVDVGSKLVIVMVGLPARGKSYLTNKLTRYLNWLQHDCRVFNVGNTRRKDKQNVGPEKNPLPDNHTPLVQSPRQDQDQDHSEEHPAGEHDASFFSPENKANTELREKWAMDTLDQLLDYVINGTGSVGIFDATNSTKSRRRRVFKRIQERSNGELKVLYLESICNDPNIIESNIRLKLSGPDYKQMDPEIALNDFIGRLHNYEKAYETIDEIEEQIPGFQYVKIIDVGKKVVSYNIQGFLSSQTIYFLLNFNLCERQIWITRHGESRDNLNGRIGGDSHLTKRGDKFAKTLARFMNVKRAEFRKQQLERFSLRLESKYNSMIFNEKDVATLDSFPTEPNFCVWTSMLIRAIETGQYFNEQLYSVKQLRMLNELGGGKFEGMTYDEIQHKNPKEFEARLKNKLSYRYPGIGGESYLDVLTRLRPLITEIERTTDHLLIISHRVVLRILLAYFLNLDKSAIGELDVPLHTLYCLESKPYGTDYTMYDYDEKLDWFIKSEPDHQKNLKEVGVVFRERKYSVVPTAPPSFRRGGPNGGERKLVKPGINSKSRRP
ncbi:6-phosphofructo-2-kinase 1 [Spathaspora sp. JA1]|nr:6-phosphofructo-2-kinase 1 [Spathaspora sp. JA1]